MAKLLYSATMSVDGFIAGPGGYMSWLSEHVGEKNQTADRLHEQNRAIVCGAVTFFGDDPNRGTDAEGAFGGQYDGPVVLLTHRPPQPPPEGLVVATDLESAVATAKEMAGDKYVNILGANVARQCIEQQLLDEILVFTAPVLLGDGVRLFDRPGGRAVRMEQLSQETESWFRVVY